MSERAVMKDDVSQRDALSGSVARGLALFVGMFCGINLWIKWSAGVPGFDPNAWWVNLGKLPGWLGDGMLLSLAVSLLVWGVAGRTGVVLRRILLVMLSAFVIATFLNACGYWKLAWQGRITAWVPLPLSLLFGGGLGFIAWHLRKPVAPVHRTLQFITVCLCLLLFPVLQTIGFGKTDYRRPADVAVVFGARAYADGRLSTALADRVQTACDLYQQRLVGKLIFSGGPGDGAIHECEAMRRFAVKAGVHPEDIELDTAGYSTAATVNNTAVMARGKSLIAVSEFYHLPRIKFAYQHAGMKVITVPTHPERWPRAIAASNVLREIPAFWAYYLGALTGQL